MSERRPLVRHLAIAAVAGVALYLLTERAQPVRQPAARDDGLLLRRRRRADRAHRPQRADLARPRRADGGRRLRDGEGARRRGHRAAAGRRAAGRHGRRRGRRRARGRGGGAAARALPGRRDARARGRAAGARAALPGLPRRRRTGSPWRRRSRRCRSARRSRSSAGRRGSPAPGRARSPTSLLANLVRSGVGRALPRRARRRGRRRSSPGCTSRARRCSRSWSARRAPGWPAGCSSSSPRWPRPGAFPLGAVGRAAHRRDPRRARQPRRRGLGRGRARARPDLGRRRQQGAVAVGQRPGEPRARRLRRRADRRDARRARRLQGRCAAGAVAASGTTIRGACRGGGGGHEVKTTCSRPRPRRRWRSPRCGSGDDAGGGGVGLVGGKPTASAPGHHRDARSPSAATSRSPARRRRATARSRSAIDAYFKYVNANGGVNGRKLKMITRDDGYNPTNTVKVTKQLVLQDKVFAILGGLGTPTHTKVVDFLNASRVPDLFVSSGCLCWDEPEKHPYTFGWQPDYIGRGQDPRPVHRAELQGQEGRLLPAERRLRRRRRQGPGHVRAQGARSSRARPTSPATPTSGRRWRRSRRRAPRCRDVHDPRLHRARRRSRASSSTTTRSSWSRNVGSDPTTLTGLLKAFSKGKAGERADRRHRQPTPTCRRSGDTSNSWIALFKQDPRPVHPEAARSTATSDYGMALAYTFVEALQRAGREPDAPGHRRHDRERAG